MSKFSQQIWFWQTMLTPHMGALADSLAEYGHRVVFVANEGMSKERLIQGWQKIKLSKATIKFAKNKKTAIRFAREAPINSIHLCQGLMNNDQVGDAQRILRKRGLRHWVMIEKIDDEGWKGKVKVILYNILFSYWKKYLEGVLAIGYGTKNWIVKRGMKKSRVFSFAYFLKESKFNERKIQLRVNNKNQRYRFIFVGRLVKSKKIDLLINAIAGLKLRKIELWIVGDGPEKERLYSLANLLLPGRVYWLGTLPMSKISKMIRQADCLVLPSSHDGWGAVSSEALIAGTPVICSNACGSSVVVKASGVGGVFLSKNQKSLTKILYNQYRIGKIFNKKRQKIAKWAKCLNANSGAKYLNLILNSNSKKLIKEPWKN